MGLFNRINKIRDGGRGARLERGLRDTRTFLASTDTDIRINILMGFSEKTKVLRPRIRNMTPNGCMKMGYVIQGEARDIYDIDITESYALFMAGAWLESMGSESESSQEVHAYLDNLAIGLAEIKVEDEDEEEFEDKDDDTLENEESINRDDYAEYAKSVRLDENDGVSTSIKYATWDEWYKVYKNVAAKYNAVLEVHDDGHSLIDYMNNDPIKRAFRDGVDPESLAREFAEQFDILSFMRGVN